MGARRRRTRCLGRAPDNFRQRQRGARRPLSAGCRGRRTARCDREKNRLRTEVAGLPGGMKILYLHPRSWTGEYVILQALRDLGHEVCVLEERGGPLPARPPPPPPPNIPPP